MTKKRGPSRGPSETPDAESSSSISLRDAAHAYARRGWHVVPLHGVREDGSCSCGNTEPGHKIGKHPIRKGWRTEPKPSGADIEELWARYPNANVGIVTGKASGIWVADIDPDNGGDVALARLIAEHGELIPTYTVRTGSGGTHYYFTLPPDFTPTNSAGSLPVGIDVRGEGGLVVAPPSVTDKGHYVVVSDVDPAPSPEWLLGKIRPTGSVTVGLLRLDRTKAGAYFDSALHNETGDVAAAEEGTRNSALYLASLKVGALLGAELGDEATAVEALTEAGESAGLGATEVAATIRSGLSAGRENPRQVELIDGSEDWTGETAPSGRYLDWAALWAAETVETDWLVEPIIAAGQAVALYSPAKTGKSLLLLEVAAALATGRPVLGNPRQ